MSVGHRIARRPSRLGEDPRKTLALILAGGVGSRLNVLVHRRAKPAVPFGGIYRIIDFAMSNVMNSGLERVGILTQYLPYSLTDHIGNGHPWGLVGRSREVTILPPHQAAQGSDWYQGTADAVFRNLGYVERHDPEQVLILSGDHVYSMDYAAMISEHVDSGAEATIAVRTVPWDQASSFGTIHVDDTGSVARFEEKPANPTSNLISMGIYVFRTEVLLRTLREITAVGEGADFGHHIFPKLLQAGARLKTHRWDGYWQDVGTIRAYFDCHRDLIDPEAPLDLRSWRVRTNLDERGRGDRPAAYFGASASVRESLIARGCKIRGTVSRSILSPGVVVEAGAEVRSSILMTDCRIEAGAVLENVILDKDVAVEKEARVGVDGENRINERFPTHLDSGITLVGKGARIAPRIQIGKNVVIFPGIDLVERGAGDVASGETVDRRSGSR
jgi:glucose-1-phosphate adenylyltransferase